MILRTALAAVRERRWVQTVVVTVCESDGWRTRRIPAAEWPAIKAQLETAGVSFVAARERVAVAS